MLLKLSSLDKDEIKLSFAAVHAVRNSQNLSSASKRIICYNCEIEGHSSRFCKQQKVKCGKCNKYGHRVKFCHSKNFPMTVSSVELNSQI